MQEPFMRGKCAPSLASRHVHATNSSWFAGSHGMATLPAWLTADAKLVYVSRSSGKEMDVVLILFARDGKSEMQVPFDQIMGKSNPLKLPDVAAVEAGCVLGLNAVVGGKRGALANWKKLDEALEKVPYFRLFGADICERYFKLFIRGDESSPIMLGELGGSVLPDFTEIELTSVTREVEGHRIRGTMETLPCLDVTLLKAPEFAKTWDELIYSEQEVLNKPQGSLEEFQVQRSRREPSPDRADWTPDDFADEQKEKADAAFKDGEYRDAIVYYTRALRHTPRNERLLSNRSGAYCKLSKFQLALDDVELAMQIEPKWSKLFYRKGHALRGLRRWNEALDAFREGKVLDPQNPDWDKEVFGSQGLPHFMGISVSPSAFLFGRTMGISASRRKSQVLVVGLDAAGKTSLLYKLSKKVEMTIPTIGFNVEHAELSTGCELISIDAWDVGGRDKLRPLWRHFYAEKNAVIFVIDSNDRDRFPEALIQLINTDHGAFGALGALIHGKSARNNRKIYMEDQLSDLPMLIFANKQDLPQAARASELVEALELRTLRQQWQIFESSCEKNQGIQEGMAWLVSAIHGRSPMDAPIKAEPKDVVSDASTVASDGETTP
eukprot:s315_g20.t1